VTTDDLTTRLRDCATANAELGSRHRAALLREAADELARLRGERVGYEEALHGQADANDELRQEVARLRAEAGPPRVLTDDQLRFVCRVLETPVGAPSWEGNDAVDAARDDVACRYRAAKQTGPTLSYGECSLWARAAWLRDWLAGLTQEGG
jgi:hypothetical protein